MKTCSKCRELKKSSEFRPTHAQCKTCHNKYMKAYRSRVIANGRCEHCLNPVTEGRTTCSKCSEQRKAIRHLRIAEGRCYDCARPTIPNSIRCEVCLFKRRAKEHLGSRGKWQILQHLYQIQNGLCAVTGKPLPIAKAHLDHIVPRDKGGTSELSNLRLTFDWVNKMKLNHTEEEFIGFVRSLYEGYRKLGKIL